MNPFKKKQPPEIWKEEPYAFERGLVYIISFDSLSTSMNELADLDKFFTDQGIHVKFVPSHMQLKPLNSKSMQRRVQ